MVVGEQFFQKRRGDCSVLVEVEVDGFVCGAQVNVDTVPICVLFAAVNANEAFLALIKNWRI